MLKEKIFLFLFYTSLSIFALVFLSIYFLHTGSGAPVPAVIEYRTTRILLAIFAGGILALSGNYLQSALRNPLVDHYILGVGSGAVFSTYLFYLIVDIYGINSSYNLVYFQSASGIVGGLTALTITIIVAEYVGGSDTAYVLAGIGVTSVFSGAAIVLSCFIIPKHPYIVHALIGSLVLASRKWVPILGLLYATSLFSYILLAKPLNAVFLGDEYAHQLGYNPRRIRFFTILYAGVVSSIVVACCGTIGFLGLVVPHLARFLLKTSDNRYTIPLSFVIGSLILLIADNFSRIYLVSSIGEVPVGALVSLMGAPFYLIILAKRLRRL